MLYVTTRSNRDAYTPQRVLRDGRGSDGGLFVPFRLPKLTAAEVASLGEQSFGGCAAYALNLLFGTKLTGHAVELAAGRYGVRLKNLDSRTLLAQCWHNTSWKFSDLAENLMGIVRVEAPETRCSGEWAEIGARIAALFGIFGALIREELADGEKPLDIACISGDFSGPISAFYAREMGLPVGNIICCCNENGGVWDFLVHGQLRTDGVAVATVTPEADVVVPVSLERLVHYYGGTAAVERYVTAVHGGQTYYAGDRLLSAMRKGLYATVSSDGRILSTIPNTFASCGFVISPYTALALTGLQDYRVRTARRATALVISERAPALDGALTAKAMGISEEELQRLL